VRGSNAATVELGRDGIAAGNAGRLDSRTIGSTLSHWTVVACSVAGRGSNKGIELNSYKSLA
jgi:hypothetical protein